MATVLATMAEVPQHAMAEGSNEPPLPVSVSHQVVMRGPVRCPNPANPFRRSVECRDERFEFLTDTLTGDWNKIRQELHDFGITPTMSYTTQVMGNTSGASSSRMRYAGQLNASVAVDLEKLLKAPGLSFTVSGAWGSGGNLSDQYLGNLFGVMNAAAGAGVWLTQCYLQETLMNGDLIITAGRLGQTGTFVSLPVFANYLNGGINGPTGSLSVNYASFAAPPPGTQWGVQTIYSVTPTIQAAAGVFNTNPNSATGTDNGVNLAFQQGNYGAMLIGQVSYLSNHGHNDTGMPGQYTFGGLYDGNRFASLSTGGSTTGNWNLYALFQQMVYRAGDPGNREGLTVWSDLIYTTKSYVNRMPLFLGAGLSYQGLFPGRTADIASVGWLYGKVSSYIPSTTAEQVIEVNYQVALSRFLTITPDFQYVLNPGGYVGSSGLPNAAVFGAQVSVTF